jgi:hypothetical protein
MLMQRYTIFHDSILGFSASKINIYRKSKNIYMKSISIMAGLYKLNYLQIQHSLIFSSIIKQQGLVSFHLHGKRARCTSSINATLISKNI